MYSVRFLGTGNAAQHTLGHACCVIEKDDRPWMMIDCGHDSVKRFEALYPGQFPESIYITHLHFDHIGGLEQLFYRCALDKSVECQLFVPAHLVVRLTQILQSAELAEGGANLWDTVRIVPVIDHFWHEGAKLISVPVRHHQPLSAFGLHMPGVFFYSGDTKPIPEYIHHNVQQGELIMHDCGLVHNPSHTCAEELLRDYSADVVNRTLVYHYASEADIETLRGFGLHVATPGLKVPLQRGQNVTPLSEHLSAISRETA